MEEKVKDKALDELAEIFQTPELLHSMIPDVVEKSPKIEIIEPIHQSTQSFPIAEPRSDEELVEDDFKYARESLREIIDTGRASLNMLKDIADGTCDAEAYEALGSLIRTISDSTMGLIQLHGKMKEIRQDGPKKVTNNLVITTDELIKMIKGGK